MSNTQAPQPNDSETVAGVVNDSAQANESVRMMLMGSSGEACQAHSVNAAASKKVTDDANTTSGNDKEGDAECKTK
ncbi:hypothetical protein NMY22_g17396 [Coprinellus aureogranulatus]|nr:hypothetical protein NMY22_g17396 [Coprinellus aureogranulatus]